MYNFSGIFSFIWKIVVSLKVVKITKHRSQMVVRVLAREVSDAISESGGPTNTCHILGAFEATILFSLETSV